MMDRSPSLKPIIPLIKKLPASKPLLENVGARPPSAMATSSSAAPKKAHASTCGRTRFRRTRRREAASFLPQVLLLPEPNRGVMISVKRSARHTTIPVPGSPSLAEDLAATASDTGLSQADVIRQSLKLGMPSCAIGFVPGQDAGFLCG